MTSSKKSYFNYLERELLHTKKILLELNKPDTIKGYLKEILKLEEALTHFKALNPSERAAAKNRQNVPGSLGASPSTVPPQVNTPPTPTPDIPTSSASATPAPITPINVPDRVFTLGELSQYTGLNGNPAYVALYGLVFDISNISTWGGGSHFGLFAGTDTTPMARACGFHNPGAIMRIMPVVGRLEAPFSEAAGIGGTMPTGPSGLTVPSASVFPTFPVFPTTPATLTAPSQPTENITFDTTVPRKF